MSTRELTRRAAVASLVGSVLAGSAAKATSQATEPAGLRFRSVEVDTSPLIGQSGEVTARWAREALQAQLAQTFAARMARADSRAATLHVRIDSVVLGAGGVGREGDAIDSMTGVATIAGGREASIPLRATSVYSPAADDEEDWERTNQRRIAALAQAFAGWLAREPGL